MIGLTNVSHQYMILFYSLRKKFTRDAISFNLGNYFRIVTRFYCYR